MRALGEVQCQMSLPFLNRESLTQSLRVIALIMFGLQVKVDSIVSRLHAVHTELRD